MKVDASQVTDEDLGKIRELAELMMADAIKESEKAVNLLGEAHKARADARATLAKAEEILVEAQQLILGKPSLMSYIFVITGLAAWALAAILRWA